MGIDLSKGARWEFVNKTMGTVTPYVIVSEAAITGESASSVYLRNEETDGIAQVRAVSLMRPLGDQASHWRPA